VFKKLDGSESNQWISFCSASNVNGISKDVANELGLKINIPNLAELSLMIKGLNLKEIDREIEKHLTEHGLVIEDPSLKELCLEFNVQFSLSTPPLNYIGSTRMTIYFPGAPDKSYTLLFHIYEGDGPPVWVGRDFIWKSGALKRDSDVVPVCHSSTVI
jgi:hypothetical protein